MVDIPPTILESDLFVRDLKCPEELQCFVCGDDDLDDFLQSEALIACTEGTSKTHLVYYENVTLVGFFPMKIASDQLTFIICNCCNFHSFRCEPQSSS